MGLRISGSSTPARAAGSIGRAVDGWFAAVTMSMVRRRVDKRLALVSEAVTELPPLRASDWRVGVWRAYLRTHAEMVRRLERDLQAQADMPLGWYDVLLQLAEAPERRLRMAELAEQVLLSRSGLTRLVDRLAAEGLVTREPFPGDARGLYTVLTDGRPDPVAGGRARPPGRHPAVLAVEVHRCRADRAG